jgi:hypothetical protein
MHHHRLDAHAAAGADDAEGDLAAIRDQDAFEHGPSDRGADAKWGADTDTDTEISERTENAEG